MTCSLNGRKESSKLKPQGDAFQAGGLWQSCQDEDRMSYACKRTRKKAHVARGMVVVCETRAVTRILIRQAPVGSIREFVSFQVRWDAILSNC